MAVLLGQESTGVNAANSNAAGQAFAQRLPALQTGAVTALWLRCDASGPAAGGVHAALYADNAGGLTSASRLSADITGNFSAGAWVKFPVSPVVDVTAGTFYWIEWLGVGAALGYTNFAAAGGTERDTASALTTLAATHPATTASFTNIFNTFAEGDVAPVSANSSLPMRARS